MDRLTEDCRSIEELNELIDRGLDEYRCQMSVNRVRMSNMSKKRVRLSKKRVI
jgi:hypothetical protein